jgi:S-formylglutathione hydrolase FrmB
MNQMRQLVSFGCLDTQTGNWAPTGSYLGQSSMQKTLGGIDEKYWTPVPPRRTLDVTHTRGVDGKPQSSFD